MRFGKDNLTLKQYNLEYAITTTFPHPSMSSNSFCPQVFGVFNMITYAVGAFYLYRDWKDSHPHTTLATSVLKRNP